MKTKQWEFCRSSLPPPWLPVVNQPFGGDFFIFSDAKNKWIIAPAGNDTLPEKNDCWWQPEIPRPSTVWMYETQLKSWDFNHRSLNWWMLDFWTINSGLWTFAITKGHRIFQPLRKSRGSCLFQGGTYWKLRKQHPAQLIRLPMATLIGMYVQNLFAK